MAEEITLERRYLTFWFDITGESVYQGRVETSPALEFAVRTLDSIIAASTEALREAFELGRNVGRAEASADLRTKIADLLAAGQSTLPNGSLDLTAVPSDGRATQGSVKPTIARMIVESATEGLTPGEITERTGFKPNTVRGTIWTLSQEGSIVKRERRWYPKDEAPL